MMSNGVVHTLFSWTFLVGFIVGVIVQRAWCVSKAKYLNYKEPGTKHRPGGLDRSWVAFAIASIIIGAVMLSTQQTAASTQRNFDVIEQLSRDVKDCQEQFFKVIKINR